MDHLYRQRFEKFVGVEKPPTLVISTFEAAEFVATRVEWERSEGGHPTQFDRADGYMLCLQRRALPEQTYWADDHVLRLPAMRPGQFLLLDLNIRHGSIVPSDVDCISILTPTQTLTRFQEEHDLPLAGLNAPLAMTHEDPVILHLAEALLPALTQGDATNRLWSDHVALALLSRMTARHGAIPSSTAFSRGALAPWQERRAKEMMLAHFDGRIGLEALAVECRLSRSHFARAFKVSTGLSPLRWLSEQRLLRAKSMLSDTNLSIEEIASACGFTDSSHLSRAFLRATNFPPGAWRRLRRL